MDAEVARKILVRHKSEIGLVQLRIHPHKQQFQRYRHHLVEAGVRFNDWPAQPVSAANNFYARPLALFMASRTDQ